MKIRLFLIISIGLLQYSCTSNIAIDKVYTFEKPPKTNIDSNNRGGVVITFDDKFVNEWFALDSYISSKFKWQATFFVTRFNSLNTDEIKNLKILQKKGHEIGYHGADHRNAIKYIDDNSLEEYVQNEIAKELEDLNKNGIKLYSFAYPYGAHTKETDSVLLNYFSVLRTVHNPTKAEEVSKNIKVIPAIGIEEMYSYFSEKYLLELLLKAKQQNKVLVFYGHNPKVKADKTKHEVSYRTIDLICSFVTKHNMRMFKMQDLYSDNLSVLHL